jgi:hypothetical protein
MRQTPRTLFRPTKAKELKYRLNHEFEILNIIKPGSTPEKLVKMNCSNLKTLTKRDVCLVWGGTNVRRNETNMGIRALNDFLNSHEHTNVIVLNVHHRLDLAPNSCVNYEVTVFYRKLGRERCIKMSVSVITVNLDRDLYTRHEFHLNAKGKEQTANRITSAIKDLLCVNKALPRALKWKAKEDRDSYPSVNKKK